MSIAAEKHRQFPDEQTGKKHRKLLDNPKDITDKIDRIEQKHYDMFLWLDELAQAHGRIYDQMAEMRIGKISPSECVKRLRDTADVIEEDNKHISNNTKTEVVLLIRNTAQTIESITHCNEDQTDGE